MATFIKVNGFIENLAHGNLDLGGDQLRLGLSNTLPSSETPNPVTGPAADAIIGNVTEIAYTNLSGGVTSLNVARASSGQTGGVYTLAGTDMAITAGGSALPDFRYVYLYSQTTGFLIGYWDYSTTVSLGAGQSLDIDFSSPGDVLLTINSPV